MVIIKRPQSSQPLPKRAKLVYKGSIFQVYKWKQKLYDGSSAIFEKVKQQDTVNVIPVTDDGKIILTKQKQPLSKVYFGTVGGRMEKGETPLKTAKREMLEEIGYKSNKYILWRSQQIFSKIDWVSYIFIAKNSIKTMVQKPDAGEKIEPVYLDFDAFIDKVCNRNFRNPEITLEILKTIRDKKKYDSFTKLLNLNK